jgi:hypothetical protein
VTNFEDVYHPNIETETTVSDRTALFVAEGDGKLAWSVASHSVDPTSADQFRNFVANRVVSPLKKERLIC